VIRPDVTGRGQTCRFAEVILAGRDPTRPCAGGRWLPVWLPGIWLATLMFGRSRPWIPPSSAFGIYGSPAGAASA